MSSTENSRADGAMRRARMDDVAAMSVDGWVGPSQGGFHARSSLSRPPLGVSQRESRDDVLRREYLRIIKRK